MGKIFWVLTSIFFFFAVIISFAVGYIFSIKGPIENKDANIPVIPINYSNIETQLSQTYLVKAIPSEEVVSLKFYNFDSGERTIEKSFLIRQGSLMESDEASEVVLFLHSKYIADLTNKNFCETLKKANQNGDLSIETNLSEVSLAWKFKSMYEFKDCF
jgi:hypothetical protein